MGSRVNLVLARDRKRTVYAPGDFADGQWFDDGSCEGGVLIDVDRRHPTG